MEHETYPFFCGRSGMLRVLDAGYAKCKSPADWSAAVTSPGHSRLYYILSGDPSINFGGKETALEPGRCFLLPTGFSFTHSCKTGMEQFYFHLRLQSESGYDLLRDCSAPLSVPFSERFPAALSRCLHEQGAVNALALESMVLASLAELMEAGGFSPSEPALSPCVKAAVARITENPSIQLTPGILAEQVFVSPSSLIKKFRAEIGKPLGQYIDDMVFFEAEQLLIHSELTIFEISARLGFCDQFYFSRRFKEKYRISPQQYRKIRHI